MNSLNISRLEKEIALHAIQTGRLTLTDANTSINQCHIVSLRIIQMCHQISSMSEEEKTFATCCVQTSPAIALLDHNTTPQNQSGWYLLYQNYRKHHPHSSNVTKEEREKEKQQMMRLGKDLLTQTLQESRKQNLENSLFSYIDQKGSPDIRELGKRSDLVMPGQRLRTFPKYAGISLIGKIQATIPSSCPIVVKIKYVDSINSHVEVLYAKNWDSPAKPLLESTEIDLKAPAIVIEGVSLPKGTSYQAYQEVAKHCPHQLLLRDRKNVHSEETQCPCCHFSKVGKEWKIPLPEEPIGRIVQKIAAAFQYAYQPTLPLTEEGMERDFHEAENLGLSYANPSLFVIEHIHTDQVEKAISLARLLDLTPQNVLRREAL